MKRLLEISSEERNRILEMHQNATKKNYLMEDSTTPPLKISSVQSAIYTTCNPKKQSNWNSFKTELSKTILKNINWDTLFKESSNGSRFGIQGQYIWEFSQSDRDGFGPVPSNTYKFYTYSNDGVIQSFAKVKYGCQTNWGSSINDPSVNPDRNSLLPEPVWYNLINKSGTDIPDELIIGLLKFIKNQPNINPKVYSALMAAQNNNLRATQNVNQELINQIKNSNIYKAFES